MSDRMNLGSTFSNNLTPAQSERLALLAEECGETVQVIGKCLRHGLVSRDPDRPDTPFNHALLEREIGDVFAAVQLLVLVGVVDIERIALARDSKLERVRKWLHHD